MPFAPFVRLLLALAATAALLVPRAPAAASWSSATPARLVAKSPEAGIVAGRDGRYWLGAGNAAGDSLLLQVDVPAAAVVRTLPLESEALALVAAADGGSYVATSSALGETVQVTSVAPDGTPRWSSSVGDLFDQPRLLAYANGDVLAVAYLPGFDGGQVRLARLRGTDGTLAWTAAIAVTDDECLSVGSVGLLAGNRIHVACSANDAAPVFFVDGANGQRTSSVPLAVGGASVRTLDTASNETSDLYATVDVGGERRVLRIDAATRAVRWNSSAADTPLFLPGLDATHVFASRNGDEVYALRVSDGGLAWHKPARELVLGAPGVAYLVSVSDTGAALARVDAATGVERWTQPLATPFQWELGATYAAAAGDGVVVLRPGGVATRTVVAVDSWTAAGQQRPTFSPSAPGSRYAFVDESGGSLLVARDESDGSGSRTYARSIDAQSGAVRWDVLAYASTATELAATATCHGSDGTLVVASAAAAGSLFSPRGVARIAGFDPATGVERWHADVGGGAVDGYIESAFCDGARHVYVSAARRAVGSAGASARAMLAFDSASGALLWEVPVAATYERADLAFTDRGATEPLLRTNQSVAPALQMLSAANGGSRWTTALPDVNTLWLTVRTLGGDPIQYSQVGLPANQMDVIVHRLDAGTGAVRWSRRLDGPYGGRQTASVLSVGPGGELYPMWRNVEAVTGRGAIARLRGDSGAVDWSVEVPRPASWQPSLSNLRARPGEDRVQLRQQVFLPFDPTRGERYSLVSLVASSGAWVDSRDFGSQSYMDPGPYTYAPAQLAVFDDGSLLSRRFVGGIGTEPAMVLRREPAAPAVVGNGTASLALGTASGSNPMRVPFRMEARWQGGARVEGAVLRTVFPGNVVIASAQCRIEGGGACGEATRLRQWRQTISLDPDARAVVEGTIEMAFAEDAPVALQAWLELPFAFADTDAGDDVATARPGPGLAAGLVADARFSGSWFNPQRSGEGWILEMLPDGSALLFWFTYPPTGSAGDQQWLIAQNGHVQGSRIVFEDIYLTSGTRFGGGFNAADVRLSRWGDITIDFDDCNSGTLSYSGRSPFGSGNRRSIVRLTSLAGVECGGPSSPPSAIRSGAWYDPQRAGEGWIVEALPDGRASVYWFTYSPDGNQAWTFGTGTLVGERLRIDDMRRPRGTRFGTSFNAANIDVAPWGTLQVDFSGCNGGTLSYTSSEAGYEPATRNITRLTRIAGTNCR